MSSRWRRVLLPLATGVSVVVGLALLTPIVVDERPRSSSNAAYAGWVVETGFDEEYNASTAQSAFEAQGFNVTDVEPGRLQARNGSVSVELTTAPDRGTDPSNATFRLTVSYYADGEDVDSDEEALERARQARPGLEDRFQAFLDDFEAKTGWTHVGEPEWQPLIAV